MFASDITFADLERLGAVTEPLVNSTRLTEDEKWAIETAVRATAELVMIRHSEVARNFYARDEIHQRSVENVEAWLRANHDAPPGTVTAICGRLHVASVDTDGILRLYPVLEL